MFWKSKNRKSICIILEVEGYGTKTHAFDLVQKILERGYAVEIVSCRFDIFQDYPKPYDPAKVKFILTPLSAFDRKVSFSAWNRLLKGIKSPVVILERSSMFFGTHAFLFSCRCRFRRVYYIHHYSESFMPKKKQIKHFLGLMEGLELWWHRERFMRFLKSLYSTKIIAVSEYMRQHLIHDWAYPRNKVMCVHNGIFWHKFMRDKKLGLEFRKKYGLSAEATVFGMLTRFDPDKGVDIGIEAFGQFMKNHNGGSFYLVLVGGGSGREKILSLVKSLNLEDRVIFCGFCADPRPALSSFDVLLSPSRSEVFGLCVAEAMAAECLTIISNVGGMVEIVKGPEHGWIVPSENPKELCRAMEEVLKMDETSRERIRQNALKRVKEHFNADINYQKILDVCGIT